MSPHLTLVTQAPFAVEPLFPLFQAGIPWALMGIAAAALVRPVTEDVVKPIADAVGDAAAAVGAGARRTIAVPVRAFDARLERLRAAFRRDDDLLPFMDDGQ